MGNGASSWPSFINTLTQRTKSPPTGVTVNWSGQILIGAADYPTVTAHTYCFDSDQVAQFTIDGLSASGPASARCITINPSNLVGGVAGWQPITISYTTSSGVPKAELYEQTTSGNIEVPGGTNGDLATLATNQAIGPQTAFINGLYGQYYSDLNLINRVSAYTDPLIGDGGVNPPHGFSFSNADGIANDTDPNVFLPTLRWNTASADASGKSVKWTGQVEVDTSGAQTYCTNADDGSRLVITDDSGVAQTLVNDFGGTHATTQKCGGITLSAGWHNIEVDYENSCCTNSGNPALDGAYGAVQLLHQSAGGQAAEVPNDHLRRPMDWSAVGSAGTCNAGQATTTCVHNNNSTGEWSSSASSGNSCSSSNDVGQITYTKSGLTPDSTYNMDISYFNEPNGSYVVPSSYSYLVCVAVDGTVLNGGNPVSLPISEPSLNPRTYTMSGITIPASGQATVTLDWLNDSYQLLCLPFLSCYDANFGVSRLDLYRNILPNGQLSYAPPRSSATNTTIARANQSSTVSMGSTLATRLLNAVLPSAEAANTCTTSDPTNVLDPGNYNPDCFANTSPPDTKLDVSFPNDTNSGQGTIILNTQDNSIKRIIN
jgi:hypothetical protein